MSGPPTPVHDPRVEILRERIFLAHDPRSQNDIVIEYTFRSKVSGLSNIFFIFDKILPNLLATDESGSKLSIMPTKYALSMLHKHSGDSDSERRTTKSVMQKIRDGDLHVLWLNTPNDRKIAMNEVRTISLRYSSRIRPALPRSRLHIIVKRMPHPSYYTLYKPQGFDFNFKKYVDFGSKKSKDGWPPEQVDEIDTSDSKLLVMRSRLERGFALVYSFGPTLQAKAASLLGLYLLSAVGAAVCFLKYASPYLGVGQPSLLDKQVEIGIFLVAGSLILPRLTESDSIRSRYAYFYLIPAIIGFVVAW